MKLLGIVVFLLIFSSEVWACKVTTRMAASRLFVSGVMNKLSEVPSLKDYELERMRYDEATLAYVVIAREPRTGICQELLLVSYGNGGCDDFTAEILIQTQIECPAY